MSALPVTQSYRSVLGSRPILPHAAASLCLLFLFVSFHALFAKPEKSVFVADALYVDFGGLASGTSPARIQLNPSSIYYLNLYNLWDASQRGQEIDLLLANKLIEDWNSDTRYRLENSGYIRSEISVGRFVTLGVMVEKTRLVLKQVPWHYQISEYGLVFCTAYALCPQNEGLFALAKAAFLYSDFYKQDNRINLDAPIPEFGVHLPMEEVDLYARIGVPLLSNSSDGLRAWARTASLGMRFLLYEPVTLHMEIFTRRWRIDNGENLPKFSARIIESGLRFGFGFRLTHP